MSEITKPTYTPVRTADGSMVHLTDQVQIIKGYYSREGSPNKEPDPVGRVTRCWAAEGKRGELVIVTVDGKHDCPVTGAQIRLISAGPREAGE